MQKYYLLYESRLMKKIFLTVFLNFFVQHVYCADNFARKLSNSPFKSVIVCTDPSSDVKNIKSKTVLQQERILVARKYKHAIGGYCAVYFFGASLMMVITAQTPEEKYLWTVAGSGFLMVYNYFRAKQNRLNTELDSIANLHLVQNSSDIV